jgi:hypothetical protein
MPSMMMASQVKKPSISVSKQVINEMSVILNNKFWLLPILVTLVTFHPIGYFHRIHYKHESNACDEMKNSEYTSSWNPSIFIKLKIQWISGFFLKNLDMRKLLIPQSLIQRTAKIHREEIIS